MQLAEGLEDHGSFASGLLVIPGHGLPASFIKGVLDDLLWMLNGGVKGIFGYLETRMKRHLLFLTVNL